MASLPPRALNPDEVFSQEFEPSPDSPLQLELGPGSFLAKFDIANCIIWHARRSDHVTRGGSPII